MIEESPLCLVKGGGGFAVWGEGNGVHVLAWGRTPGLCQACRLRGHAQSWAPSVGLSFEGTFSMSSQESGTRSVAGWVALHWRGAITILSGWSLSHAAHQEKVLLDMMLWRQLLMSIMSCQLSSPVFQSMKLALSSGRLSRTHCKSSENT